MKETIREKTWKLWPLERGWKGDNSSGRGGAAWNPQRRPTATYDPQEIASCPLLFLFLETVLYTNTLLGSQIRFAGKNALRSLFY